MVVKNENGHIILMALVIMLVLSIIGATLIFTSGLESKMSSNDKRIKQAILAADSGLELAREMIIEKLNNQIPINTLKNDMLNCEFVMGNDARTIIKNIDISEFQNEGKIKITSEGSYQEATKSITATLQFNNLPSLPIKADKLKIAGRYNEYIDEVNTFFDKDEDNPGWVIKTYHKPWGMVVVNGDMECRSVINAENNSAYFNTKLAQDIIDGMWPKSPLISPNPDRPAHILNSEDFFTANRQNNDIPLKFTKKDVEAFYKLAITDTENWTIWEPGTFDFADISKPFNYIKSSLDDSKGESLATDKVEVLVKSDFGIIIGDYFKLVFKIDKPKLPAWDGESKIILIVSNDKIEFSIDGSAASADYGIDLSDVTFYLLTSNNIELINNYTLAGNDFFNKKYRYNVYALAGGDIDLNSSVENVIINGSLQARRNLTIDISDRANDPNNLNNHANQALVNINGQNNKSIIDNFPLHWSLLGGGKVVEYVGE